MTTYYTGPGGSNANNGLSWANRKQTLDGVEDIPVAAGDTVYVGPGSYTSLTVDVAGTAGNIITYIGDVTGEHTDGVGGRIRISGTNDETTVSRANGISAPNARSYRTFRGLCFDAQSSNAISIAASSDHWIIEDCVFLFGSSSASAIIINGTGGNHVIRRCFFLLLGPGINITHSSTVNDTATLIENSVFIVGGAVAAIRVDRVGGITVKNCTILSGENGIRVQTALAAGQVLTVNNCNVCGTNTALVATVTTEYTEDYNNVFGNGTARSNVTAGSNSVAYPPNFKIPFLLAAGFMLPMAPLGMLSDTSALLGKTGTGTATDDFFGITRPATASKISWGAIQSMSASRNTGTVHGGSVSLQISDAGERFLMRIPISNVSTTISMYVQRQTDYAGTNPSMVIKQAGQSDRVTTDGGSASTWNQLTDTFTPAASPPYVDVFIRSENTATSGSYIVFVDTVVVSPLQDPGEFENFVNQTSWPDVIGSPSSGGGLLRHPGMAGGTNA